MANIIGAGSSPATVVRPTTVKAKPEPKATPSVVRPTSLIERMEASSAPKKLATTISKASVSPTRPATSGTPEQMQQRLNQARPVSFASSSPSASPTWSAAAVGLASSGLVKSADPKASAAILADYAKKAGEDLTDDVKGEVLDKVRDGLVERAESCVSPSATKDLKKFDEAQLGFELGKATLEAAEAQKALDAATTPAEKIKATVDLQEARQDGAEAVGSYLENTAERQKIEEKCQPLGQTLPKFTPLPQGQPVGQGERGQTGNRPATEVPGLSLTPGLPGTPTLSPDGQVMPGTGLQFAFSA